MPKLEMVSPGELEAESVQAAEGKMSMKPIFYGTGKDAANAAVLKVYDDRKRLVHTYVVRMRGSDLALTLLDRTKPVQPTYERKPNVQSTVS